MGKGWDEERGGLREVCLHWTSHCGGFFPRSASPQCKDAGGSVAVMCFFCFSQKSPAKKLSHALSKSLSCASSREPLHPMFPEMPEKPLNLHHIV